MDTEPQVDEANIMLTQAMVMDYQGCGMTFRCPHWWRQKCSAAGERGHVVQTPIILVSRDHSMRSQDFPSSMIRQLVNAMKRELWTAAMITSSPAPMLSIAIDYACTSFPHVFGLELHAQPAKNNTVRELIIKKTHFEESVSQTTSLVDS